MPDYRALVMAPATISIISSPAIYTGSLGRHSFKAGMTVLHYDYYVNGISQTLAFTAQPTRNLAVRKPLPDPHVVFNKTDTVAFL